MLFFLQHNPGLEIVNSNLATSWTHYFMVTYPSLSYWNPIHLLAQPYPMHPSNFLPSGPFMTVPERWYPLPSTAWSHPAWEICKNDRENSLLSNWTALVYVCIHGVLEISLNVKPRATHSLWDILCHPLLHTSFISPYSHHELFINNKLFTIK